MQEIMGLLENAVSKRTVQYRVSLLIKGGEVFTKGTGKNVRYFIKQKAEQSSLLSIPFSQSAQQVLSLISKPMHERLKVAYEKNFLEAYKPNQTCYLSLTIIGDCSLA